MGEEFAFPTEWAVVTGERLLDQIDRLPFALADPHRVGIAGHHLGCA
jgi:hypothetical protein